MAAVYLAGLLVSIGGLLLLDWRHRLFFFHDAIAAAIVTFVGVVGFLIWDLAGIASGIFLRGDSPIATGVVLAPELPLEEPVFLVLLVLSVMIVFTGTRRLVTRGRS